MRARVGGGGWGFVERQAEAVIGEAHPGGELRFVAVVVEIVSEVGEEGARGGDAAGGGEGFIQAHVGGVRFAAEGVEDGDLDATDLGQGGGGDGLAVAEVSQARPAILTEEEPGRGHAAVWQRQGNDLEIAEGEGPSDHAGVGLEVTARDGLAGEGVLEDPLKVGHGLGRGVDGQWGVAQIAEAPAIVQAHDMVGVAVSEEDRVERADVLAEDLHPELGRGVHDQLDAGGGDVERGAGAMVFRVGQERGRIRLADDGHTLRGAGSQEDRQHRHGSACCGAGLGGGRKPRVGPLGAVAQGAALWELGGRHA